ncbi:2-hydroxyacyl-CoA dehydratase subunit D [Carboxydothermus pertinax]|uniref:2-hydroxyglutaryl-CoA dehydratase n=1 Tax=Carboxydothermus pertinax TaxID=870242 RepID=A0A1L8CV27_9THEO|nr:2-hydroxyacyl-CoA dehydratase family protein [Carboxydothermus pertinax]GAV22714.1 2-hydroxyglutaryl-CoA dehydratase [Carboxydothermus pertinax]
MKLAYFCSYWPVEISEGAGFPTVRYFPRDEAKVPVRLPSYCCSYAKGSLAEMEEEALDMLFGFAHSCDTMQCMYGIAKSLLGNDKVFLLVPPVDLTTPEAREYYTQALTNLWQELAGKKDLDDLAELKATWEKYQALRAKVKALENLAPYVSSWEIFDLLKKIQTMPVDEALAYLESFKDFSENQDSKQIGLILTGAVITQNNLYKLLEEQGFRVFYDDTCTGFRHFAGEVVDDDNIFAQIASYYISKPPCPCRHKGMWERAQHLKTLYESKKARAILLVQNKFCDPFAWDVPYLLDYFKKEGIPALVLEVDGGVVGEQNKTRLQAFRERIGGI